MNNDLVKKSYNKSAEKYLSQRDQFKNIKYLEKLNELLKPSSLILDIGCGAGKPIDEWLIIKGHKVIGIDISEKQIQLAKKNVPQGKFKVEDMSDLQTKEYQVDALVSFYAIFHTPRETHQSLFKKIASFLQKDCLILVTMGAGEWEGKEQDFHGAEMYWSHYGVDKNRKIIQNAGFKILLDEIDEGVNERHQVVIAKKVGRG